MFSRGVSLTLDLRRRSPQLIVVRVGQADSSVSYGQLVKVFIKTNT